MTTAAPAPVRRRRPATDRRTAWLRPAVAALALTTLALAVFCAAALAALALIPPA